MHRALFGKNEYKRHAPYDTKDSAIYHTVFGGDKRRLCMDKDTDRVVTIEMLAEACVLFALAGNGGSALKDESQTEFVRRVGEVLKKIQRHAADDIPQKGRGKKKLLSTHIQYAVKRFVEHRVVRVIPQYPSGKKRAINHLTLSATGWKHIQNVSNDFPEIACLMPELWQTYTFPPALLGAMDMQAIEEIVRKVVMEEVAKTLQWARHDLSALMARAERIEERIKSIPPPSGTVLLAEIFSSLATMFNPPSEI